MRLARDILRMGLSLQLSARQISHTVGVSHNTARRYIRLAVEAGHDWPQIEAMSDSTLKALLYPTHFYPISQAPEPDYPHLDAEMKRKGVTLQLLWHEYKDANPDGYSYATFTRHYRDYRRLQGLVMRQEHRAGEKGFIDYSGMTMPITNAATMDTTYVQLFIGVIGCSSYTFFEATATQNLMDWTGSHVRMFNFLGAVPHILVPDNLKSAVSKVCQYDPVINPTYNELAQHYRTAVVPARPYHPKDKAKAENGVRLVQRWVLASLRNRTFHSLQELNDALKVLREKLNNKPFKGLPGSRRSRYLELDLPAMRPLPAEPFELAEWRSAIRVGPDYHAVVDGHAYSVPFRLAREMVEGRLTATTVELLHGGRRVATHARNTVAGGHTTDPSHMPKSHRQFAERSPERLLDWAARIGAATTTVISHQLESRGHAEAGYRSCLGLQKLARHYGDERMEAACRRALFIKSLSYTSVHSILKSNRDRQPLPAPLPTTSPIAHDNVRGSEYYLGES